MHKNDQNLKKFSSAVPIGTADTQFLLLILKNRFKSKFSMYKFSYLCPLCLIFLPPQI